MMAGTTQRVAPHGAHLAASTRQSAWLTPEEITAARQAKEGAGNPPPPTPAPPEPALSMPNTVAATPVFTPATAMPGAPAALPDTAATLSAHVVAEMCTDAGVPELIVPMLKQQVTLSQMEARLEDARLILQCGSMVGAPELGRQLMAAGVPVATARMLIIDAKARADAAIVTDPTHSDSVAPANTSRINSAAVYARLNKAVSPKSQKD